MDTSPFAHSPLSRHGNDDDESKPMLRSAAHCRKLTQQQQQRRGLCTSSPSESPPAAAPPSSVVLCASTDSDSSSTPPAARVYAVCSTQQLRRNNHPLNDSFEFTLTTSVASDSDCDSPSSLSSAAVVEPPAVAFWEEFPGRQRSGDEEGEGEEERVEFDATTEEERPGVAAFVPEPITTYTRVPSPALPTVAVAAAAVVAPVVTPAVSPKSHQRTDLKVSLPPMHELDIDEPTPLISVCEFEFAAAQSVSSSSPADLFASMRIHASAGSSSSQQQHQQQQQQRAAFASALASQKRTALACAPPSASASASASAAALPPKPNSRMVTLLPPQAHRDRMASVRDVCFPPLPQCSASASSSASAGVADSASLSPLLPRPKKEPVAFKFNANDVHFLGQCEVLSYLPLPLLQARMVCAMDAFAAAIAVESEGVHEQRQAAPLALQQLLACLGQLHQILGVDDSAASAFVQPLSVVAAHRRLEALQLLGSLIPLWLQAIHMLQARCAAAAQHGGRSSSLSSSESDSLLSLQLVAVDRILLLLLDLTSFSRLCASIRSILQGLRRGGGGSGATDSPQLTVDDSEASGHAVSLYSDVRTLFDRSGAAQTIATLLLNFAPATAAAGVGSSKAAAEQLQHPLMRRVAERAATLWAKMTAKPAAAATATATSSSQN